MERGPHDSIWGYQIVHRDLKPGNSESSIDSTDLKLIGGLNVDSIPRPRG